ncbi:MAG: methionyl-tRNA formyltransferase [Actinomycetota bacterium]
MRLIFAGTPEPALPSLRALIASSHEVIAVITRPDARSGRGRRLMPSPVAQLAMDAGIDVLRPVSARDPEFLVHLTELAPDCCPVVAYGDLISPAALTIPRRGWVNLHFSVLPAWRGAAPVQHALLAGDEVTGATTFELAKGLDTGPVYGVMTETIRPTDTAGDLLARLAGSGAELLLATLDGIADGSLVARPQPADGVTLAPKITVADARVDWQAPSIQVDRVVRACAPAPGAWTTDPAGERLKLGPVQLMAVAAARHQGGPLSPGQVRHVGAEVWVGTGDQPVRLDQVQPAGKRSMGAADWLRGTRSVGEVRLGVNA